MFEVSLVELAVIGLVALLVLGPEKLPRAARTAGLYLRKARATWYSIRADIERELAADDLKRAMKDTERTLRDPLRLQTPADSTSQSEPDAVDTSAAESTSAAADAPAPLESAPDERVP